MKIKDNFSVSENAKTGTLKSLDKFAEVAEVAEVSAVVAGDLAQYPRIRKNLLNLI